MTLNGVVAVIFVIITNRKSYMSFRLVPKLVTLNGIMALILCYFTKFLCTMSLQNNYRPSVSESTFKSL